jgi:AbrB family looped-hinge helix DNA binding protein
MAKVTSKYQVTVPKKIAVQYDIHPGDDIDWVAAGDVIRIVPADRSVSPDDRESRLRLFDRATERCRNRASVPETEQSGDRGWMREDLYRRGRSR